jgi:tRNA modification GTPase
LTESNETVLQISAKEKQNLQLLENALLDAVNLNLLNSDEVIVSNIRHLEALQKTEDALNRVMGGIDNPVTSDFLALDIKQALHYLGEIVGTVTTDDLLDNIFSKFCIGK